jgi:hypothetical protein
MMSLSTSIVAVNAQLLDAHTLESNESFSAASH